MPGGNRRVVRQRHHASPESQEKGHREALQNVQVCVKPSCKYKSCLISLRQMALKLSYHQENSGAPNQVIQFQFAQFAGEMQQLLSECLV